jgi:signal transduction histidine kinase
VRRRGYGLSRENHILPLHAVNEEGLMADLPSHPKDDVAAAILRAQGDLEHALAQLVRLPAFDSMAIGLATHALTHYLTVMHAGVQLLQQAWQERDESRILALLQNVEHAINLMQIAVAQLCGVTTVGPGTLLRHPVDVALFVHRVCDYYQPLAERKDLHLLCEVVGEPRLIETDPVALAAVLGNLLSSDVKFSPPGRRIWLTAHCQDGSVPNLLKHWRALALFIPPELMLERCVGRVLPMRQLRYDVHTWWLSDVSEH